MSMSSAVRRIEKVLNEYDPEFDMMPREFPKVTWVSANLAEAFMDMVSEINSLKDEMKNLQRRINDLESYQNE